MTQHEGILNKIAPIFHKLINYREHFDESDDLIFQYLVYIQKRVNKKIPVIDTLWLPYPELGLHYFISAYIYKGYLNKIVFTKESNLNKYDATVYVYIDQFVINLVINKFSFENEYPGIDFFGTHARCTYKDLFVTLIGKDTYKTIKKNIK